MRELCACSATDDEDKVVGVSTQALHHLQHLSIGLVVNGCLVHQGAVIVQQQQSLACPARKGALLNLTMPVSIQKCHSYSRTLILEMPGDSKIAFLHCGDVLG